MEVSRIIAEIDGQIARLQKARAALSGTAEASPRASRGRPKGSKNGTAVTSSPTPARKRKLSPEGRKRIADAMKKRWADRRKQSAKA